jgi:hypothetical protein
LALTELSRLVRGNKGAVLLAALLAGLATGMSER